jgi:hypothetical protein
MRLKITDNDSDGFLLRVPQKPPVQLPPVFVVRPTSRAYAYNAATADVQPQGVQIQPKFYILRGGLTDG